MGLQTTDNSQGKAAVFDAFIAHTTLLEPIQCIAFVLSSFLPPFLTSCLDSFLPFSFHPSFLSSLSFFVSSVFIGSSLYFLLWFFNLSFFPLHSFHLSILLSFLAWSLPLFLPCFLPSLFPCFFTSYIPFFLPPFLLSYLPSFLLSSTFLTSFLSSFNLPSFFLSFFLSSFLPSSCPVPLTAPFTILLSVFGPSFPSHCPMSTTGQIQFTACISSSKILAQTDGSLKQHQEDKGTHIHTRTRTHTFHLSPSVLFCLSRLPS